MTVYVQDVATQVQALADTISGVADYDQATPDLLTAQRSVASATVDLIGQKISYLDAQLAGDGETVAGLASGIAPLAGYPLLTALSANLEQMTRLLGAQAYAGRIEINLKQATG